MKKKFFLFSFLFIAISVLAQQETTTYKGKKIVLFEDGTWEYENVTKLKNLNADILLTPDKHLEIPKLKAKEEVVTHVGYSLSFNDKYKVSNWVAYELISNETKAVVERTNDFKKDPKIKKGTASDNDYKNSGYDRGHLAPAGDMAWSLSSMNESFYYSNICPQNPSFNRGIWKNLEELVRKWAVEYNSIYIVTGPVLTNPPIISIGGNKVYVPLYFYKVILEYNEQGIKGIGFIIPNAETNTNLQNYSVSIDSVEAFTGIDFFPLLPDEQENLVESISSLNVWNRESISEKIKTEKNYSYDVEPNDNNYTNSIKDSSNNNKRSVSVQCSATTKAGTRCSRMTYNASGLCWQHEGSGNTTSSGNKTSPAKETSSGTNSSGQTIYTGPRGGKYHYSSSGKKVYEKKK